MSAIATLVGPIRDKDPGCEVVIFTTGFPEKVLIEKFRGLSKQICMKPGCFMLYRENLKRMEFTFFSPHHGAFCRPTDPALEAEFVNGLPLCTVWTIGNRVVMQRYHTNPAYVTWLKERKLSLALATPIIKMIRKWEKDTPKGKNVGNWPLVFPAKKDAYTKLLQKRVVTVRTSSSAKIYEFVERLRSRFVKMQFRSLEQHLQSLNEIDMLGRRSRALPDRDSPAF